MFTVSLPLPTSHNSVQSYWFILLEKYKMHNTKKVGASHNPEKASSLKSP